MNTHVKGCVLAALLALAAAAPAQERLKDGDVVWAQWKRNAWFRGKVARVEGNKYHIAFDDGDKGVVDASGIALDRTPRRERVAVKGVRVLAKYKKVRFYPGKVTGIAGNRFDIQFDDGDKDTVGLEELRLILGPAPRKGAAQGDLKKLQGTWEVVAMEVAGKPVPPEQRKGLEIGFRGEEMTFGPANKGKTMPFTIDPTTKPRALDLTITQGGRKVTWKCIYSLEGDALKFLMPLAPKRGQKPGEGYGSVKRPESFEAKDKPFMVLTAKRQQK